MKRGAWLIGALLLAAASSARADDSAYNDALESLQDHLNAQAFSGARVLPPGRLLLDATSVYASTAPLIQKALVRDAGETWMRNLAAAGVSTGGETLIAVVSPTGGELWRVQPGTATDVESWSDDRIAYAPKAVQSGRLFGFLGGQLVTGGGNGSAGLNARFGSTFFHDRYDFSVTLGYNSISATSTSVKTYGVVGRALFPLNPKLGWNLGAQLLESSPSSGDSSSVVSVLGGLNFYLPGGSLDLTAQLGNNSTYGLQVGYTFYLTRR